VRRRADGELLPDYLVLREHVDLLPELQASLSALSQVDEAERAAVEAGHDVADPYDAVAFDPLHPAIPGYTSLLDVHHGGQGTVYRAIQETTGREVAIKVLHERSLLRQQGEARFEREVQILGQLRHPNIVTIHDSGVTGGRFYLVMDYISGHPVDDYVGSHRLSIDDKLRLFCKICEAVNAAHLQGVIHRDLKPSNIYIDERGEPLILDFGLAKLTEPDPLDAGQPRAMTMTGQFVGSLPWSSPEQAEGSSRLIDLRTDVYSLGLILYHMLSGRFPYDVEGNVRDVLDNILEAEPVSLRSSRTGIDEDVDTIVRKCLNKEPARRYQNAGAIAEDIERFLADQPILARAPSTLYQLRKLATRHKIPTVLLAALAASLAGTFALMLYHHEHDKVIVARAQKAEQRAEDEAATAQAVNDFLVNDLLAGVQPEIAQGENLTVREVLDAAAARVEHAFANQPLVEASTRTAIGQSYASLGLYWDAEPFLRKALEIRVAELGVDHPDALKSEYLLAHLLCRQGRYRDADPMTLRNLEATRSVLGVNHEQTLQAFHQRAMLHMYVGRLDEAQRMFQELLDTRRQLSGESHPATLAAMTDWTYISLVRQRRFAEAEDAYRSALEQTRALFGLDHPQTLRAMLNVAEALCAERKLDEAEIMFEDTLERFQRVLGNEHPETIVVKWFFARLRQTQGRLSDAITLLREATDTGRRILGVEHPVTLEALEALGHDLGLKGEYEQAEAVHRETLEIHRRLYGDEHSSTAHSLDCLGMALMWMGRQAEAEQCFRESCAILRSQQGSAEPLVSPLRGLVRALGAQGRAEEARPFAVELLTLRRRAAEDERTDAYRLNCYARALLTIYPEDLRDAAAALEYALRAHELSTEAYHYNRYILAAAYEANGDVEQAIAMLRRALAVIPSENSEERRLYEATLVRFLEGIGDFETAADVYRKTLERRREKLAHEPLEVAESLARLAETLVRHGEFLAAEELLRECLALGEANLAGSDWRIGEAMSLLGAALAKQGLRDDAESLLAKGHEILQQSRMAGSEQAAAAKERLERLIGPDALGASDGSRQEQSRDY